MGRRLALVGARDVATLELSVALERPMNRLVALALLVLCVPGAAGCPICPNDEESAKGRARAGGEAQSE